MTRAQELVKAWDAAKHLRDHAGKFTVGAAGVAAVGAAAAGVHNLIEAGRFSDLEQNAKPSKPLVQVRQAVHQEGAERLPTEGEIQEHVDLLTQKLPGYALNSLETETRPFRSVNFQNGRLLSSPTQRTAFSATWGNEDGHHIFMDRIFLNDGREVEVRHSGLEMSQQDSGLAKGLLAEQMDLYKRLGVSKVRMTAGLNAGGYAWARYGFTPRPSSDRDIREDVLARIKEQASRGDFINQIFGMKGLTSDQAKRLTSIVRSYDPRWIWKIADMRLGDRNIGRELLAGTQYDAQLRLDDADAMARFQRYTGVRS